MGYDIYVNRNITPVGWRAQYVLPGCVLLVDNQDPTQMKEIKNVPRLEFIETCRDKNINVFKANLIYTQKLRGDKRVRVLFRREVGIGDVLLSTIAIESLYYAYRNEIVMDYWAPFPAARELLYYNPCIRQIFDSTVKGYKEIGDAFDIFVDLHKHVGHESNLDYYEPEVYEYKHWPKVGKGRGAIWCEYFGVEPVITKPKVYLSPTEIALGKQLVINNMPRPNRPVIALSTEATSPDKCITLPVVARVAHALHNKGFNVFLVGKHENIPGPFFNCNRFSTRMVCSMFYWVSVAMTYESMLGHLAAAAGTPQLCLYGRFDARESMRTYPNIKFFGIHDRLGDRCKTKGPCWHHQPRCNHPCVKEFNYQEVAERIVRHYEETKNGDKPYRL